jgi:hypothetical protein
MNLFHIAKLRKIIPLCAQYTDEVFNLVVPDELAFTYSIFNREVSDTQGDIIGQLVLQDFHLEKALRIIINPFKADQLIFLYGNELRLLLLAIPGKGINLVPYTYIIRKPLCQPVWLAQKTVQYPGRRFYLVFNSKFLLLRHRG